MRSNKPLISEVTKPLQQDSTPESATGLARIRLELDWTTDKRTSRLKRQQVYTAQKQAHAVNIFASER